MLALQGALIGGHMVKSDVHHGMHSGQVVVEKVMIDESSISELHRSLAFYPSSLDFGAWSIGSARSCVVTLINKNTNRSVYLSSVSGKTADFYSSFFEDKVVPPQGNTTFNVVFLPRNRGEVQANLMIHTSFGQAKLPVKGEGRECPYRMRPLVGIKAPYNSTIRPEIYMYNPHSKPIQILEVYSSGGQFQLELPSGGHEGPQALWEIPPHTSKPIIRIRFHGTLPGNHTAYIRIKISETDNSKEENVLVIPVEFEILSTPGLYSPNPIIDFGKLTTNDDVKFMKVDIKNSGDEKIEVIDYKLKNVNNLVELQRSDLTLILNAKQATKNTFINGELIIRSKNKKTPNKYAELSVGIRAEIYKGSLDFQKNLTVFITGAKNYTKSERKFQIHNKFSIPVEVTGLRVDNNDTSTFKLVDFNPLTLEPGEKVNLFKISTVNESANFITNLRIETNMTSYEFPIIVCTGRLRRYTSIDSENLTRLQEDNILDYGSISFGDSSQSGYILLENPNPIPIRLERWNFSTVQGLFYYSKYLGCTNSPRGSSKVPVSERFYFCQEISPQPQMAAFELTMQTLNLKSFNGIFTFWTEVEEIQTVVKFVTVTGRLQVDQTRLHFGDCFPGKRCSADISIQSTFVRTMRVNSITVSVPGLIFEYHTRDGLPEIAANAITDIGHIHFDPKSVCGKKCYIPQEGDEEVNRRDSLEFDEVELRRRTELFRRFKWNLQLITFTLNTSKVRLFEFNSTVDIVWPKLVKGHQVLPTIEAGKSHEELITIANPSAKPIRIEISLSDPDKAKNTSLSLPLEVIEVCMYCYLTDAHVFSLGGGGNRERVVHIIKPNSVIGIPICFKANEQGQYSTLLHIRNNLTLYEAVWITGKAVEPKFLLAGRIPGSSRPLTFDINEKYLINCEPSNDDRKQKDTLLVSTKKIFTITNQGEMPILVYKFFIDDKECEGYGFKVLDCTPFSVEANGSRNIEIAFTPDFTMSRSVRPLLVVTNLSHVINYTLVATVPSSSLEACSKSLERPFWEAHMKKVSVGVLTVAFMFVLIAAFLDSDKVLKDHVQNMSKDKGPMQPPLDLRSIGMKHSSSEDSSFSNGTAHNDKIVNRTPVSTTMKKRNVKRNAVAAQIVQKEKNWVEELAKKIQSTSKSSDSSMSIQSSPPQINLSSMSRTSNTAFAAPYKAAKEEKQTSPPKKNNMSTSSSHSSSASTKEHGENMNLERNVPEKPNNLDVEKKIEPKIETNQPTESKKKILVRKTKSSPVEHNNIKEPESGSTAVIVSHSFVPDKPVEKSQKSSSRSPKESKSELHPVVLTIPDSKVARATPEHFSPPISAATSDSPTINESPNVSRTNTSQKKYGKTPGRERKKENTQPRRTERKIPKYKANSLQFTSPVGDSGSLPLNSNATNFWNTNHPTFSNIVAQKTFTSGEQLMNSLHKPFMEEQDGNNNGHDWNEADLKNDETFGSGAEPVTPIDLGPIGTRKSPSSTPIWEPLSQPIHRPTPNMTIPNAANSSFFSSNFPIGASFKYTNDNQYLGGASGLLEHVFSQSQNGIRPHGADPSMLLTWLQQRERLVQQEEWANGNRMWTPMGYQDEPTVWQTNAATPTTTKTTVRPPPGLQNQTRSSPIQQLTQQIQQQQLQLHQQQLQQQQQQQQQQQNLKRDDPMDGIQPFDPFSSLSAIWADPWHTNDKK